MPTSPKKTVETPHRGEAKRFLDTIQARVDQLIQSQGTYKLHRWKDPQLDQLYGWLGGQNGNVYFNIYENGSDLAARPAALIRYDIKFWIAKKAPKKHAQRFADCPPELWAAVLGVPVDRLELSEDSTRLQIEDVQQGDFDSLTDMAVALFLRFLITFRAFMDPNTFEVKPLTAEGGGGSSVPV